MPSKKLISFGEVLLRIGSWGSQPFGHAGQASLYPGGSECNVAITAQSLAAEAGCERGLRCDWVSALPDSELGRWVAEQLQQQGLALEHLQFLQAPMATYFLESAQPPRPMQVLDRSPGPLALDERPAFNWVNILRGASYFHTSGISAGLGQRALQDVQDALHTARSQRLTTSYDFNFRGKLWSLEAAKAKQQALLPLIDILFGGEADLPSMLDLPLPQQESDWSDLQAQLFARYPFQQVVLSQRQTTPAQESYRVVGLSPDQICFSDWIPLAGTERIGMGDAMTAAFLVSHAQQAPLQAAVQTAALCGALKAGLPGDVYPISAAQLRRWRAEGPWR